MMILTGCFAVHQNYGDIDKSLSEISNYIRENTQTKIIISAHDGRNEDDPEIRIGIVMKTEDVYEQYAIIDSVIDSVNQYLINHDDIDGTNQLLYVCFVLPVGRFSGVPGDSICEITNRSDYSSDNGWKFQNRLVTIRPIDYGHSFDRYEWTDDYDVPDIDFSGIHILSCENCSDDQVSEYLSSWPSIDTVYVSTSEQAEQLQAEYPDLAFFGYN